MIGMATPEEKIAAAVAACDGFERYRVATCACGQRNLVDTVKVIALPSQARCGRCHQVLPYASFAQSSPAVVS